MAKLLLRVTLSVVACILVRKTHQEVGYYVVGITQAVLIAAGGIKEQVNDVNNAGRDEVQPHTGH